MTDTRETQPTDQMPQSGQTKESGEGRRTFDPRPHLRQIRARGWSADYLDVKWRLAWLRTEHPEARLETEHVLLNDDSAVFRARVEIPDGGVSTGYGSETHSDWPDFIEKAETKAIGRALAALGYGTQFATDFENTAQQPIADAPVERRQPPRRPRRQSATATEDDQAEGSSEPGDFSMANYSWNHFWTWARGLGYDSRSQLEELLGYSVAQLSPGELRQTLEEYRQRASTDDNKGDEETAGASE